MTHGYCAVPQFSAGAGCSGEHADGVGEGSVLGRAPHHAPAPLESTQLLCLWENVTRLALLPFSSLMSGAGEAFMLTGANGYP